jgi:CRISPR-associated protein Csm3
MARHTAETQLGFVGKLVLDGELVCETGMHIGAGKGSLEIGGADNPVIKDSWGRPYVPGSSLKGRLRSLLEQAMGLAVPEELVYLSKRRGQEVRIHQSNRPDDEIGLLFGRSPSRMERVAGEAQGGESMATPGRLSVFDAALELSSITAQMRETQDDELTEVKSETAIDRITSQASPRTLERVPAGARFKVRMILDVLCEEDKDLVARLAQGLRLLEDDTLGGGGSRGSGRVRLDGLKLTWRGKNYYATGEAEAALVEGATTAAFQQAVLADDFAGKLA